jgi:hypothetical protein
LAQGIHGQKGPIEGEQFRRPRRWRSAAALAPFMAICRRCVLLGRRRLKPRWVDRGTLKFQSWCTLGNLPLGHRDEGGSRLRSSSGESIPRSAPVLQASKRSNARQIFVGVCHGAFPFVVIGVQLLLHPCHVARAVGNTAWFLKAGVVALAARVAAPSLRWPARGKSDSATRYHRICRSQHSWRVRKQRQQDGNCRRSDRQRDGLAPRSGSGRREHIGCQRAGHPARGLPGQPAHRARQPAGSLGRHRGHRTRAPGDRTRARGNFPAGQGDEVEASSSKSTPR